MLPKNVTNSGGHEPALWETAPKVKYFTPLLRHRENAHDLNHFKILKLPKASFKGMEMVNFQPFPT